MLSLWFSPSVMLVGHDIPLPRDVERLRAVITLTVLPMWSAAGHGE
jgi:hypothetical protein